MEPMPDQIRFAARFAKIAERLEMSSAVNHNDYEIPDNPGRYLVEETIAGDTIWAFTAETLQEAATEISASDTRRDDVRIVDLDSSTSEEDEYAELAVIMECTRIMGDGVDFIPAIQTPPYVLVTVVGGVAEIAVNEAKVQVDILDYDNLKATVCEGEGLILTAGELAYIRAHDHAEFVAEVEAALAQAE